MSDNIPDMRHDDVAHNISTQYNAATTKQHIDNEVRFAFYNHAHLMKAFKDGRAIDLKDAPKVKNKPILILGSGPTLNDAWPLIQKWKGAIMVSTTQATTLIYYGKDPDYIIILDPDTPPEEFKADTWKGRKSVIIAHPGILPATFRFWKGPLYMYRKMQPQTPFFANEQKVGYSTLGDKDDITKYRFANKGTKFLIVSEIPMLACVLSSQICIAKLLGYNKQFLIGADLSYPGEINRFTRWDYVNGGWKKTIPRPVIMEAPADPRVRIDGLLTSRMMVFYSHQIATAWRITIADVINTSNKGLLKFLPYVPLDKVVQERGNVRGYSKERRMLAAEEHLAQQNIYFIRVGKAGIMPHEFQDPMSEIPKFLTRIKATLVPQGKGDELNIEENMERFKKLFKKVTKEASEPTKPVKAIIEGEKRPTASEKPTYEGLRDKNPWIVPKVGTRKR